MNKFLLGALGIVLYTALAFGGGYLYSNNKHETKALKVEVAAEQTVNKTQNDLGNISNEEEHKTVVVREKIRYVYKTIDKEVIKYVEKTPDASVAIADPEWVRLFNASSLACDPSSPSCVARSEVSGEVTRAEALFVAKEQHQLYHSCRATLHGTQEFYEALRKRINGDRYVESRTIEYGAGQAEPGSSGSNPGDGGVLRDRQPSEDGGVPGAGGS
jgi:hypothetical protein